MMYMIDNLLNNERSYGGAPSSMVDNYRRHLKLEEIQELRIEIVKYIMSASNPHLLNSRQIFTLYSREDSTNTSNLRC